MKTYVCGDIHGSFVPIREFLKRNPQITKEQSNLILLGDAGLNFFFDYRDRNLKKKLGRYPFTYFIIRGNHEERPSICAEKEPDKWHKEEYFGGDVWVENEYPYIKYAMDYVSFYSIPAEDCYYKTLVVPGAYSVDKYYRLKLRRTWFPFEQLSEEEREKGFELIKKLNWKCDLVLSHTCPCIYEPTDLFLSAIDQSLVDKTMERYLGQIEYNLNYKAWLFGHFHQFRDYPREDGIFRTMLFNESLVNLKDYMEGNIKKL